MKQARIASLLVFGGLVLVIAGPTTESSASAEPAATPRSGAPRSSNASWPSSSSSSSAQTPMTTHAQPKPPQAHAPAPAPVPAACPTGMVEIEGAYCPLLDQKCKRWLDPEETSPRRCAEFEPSSACQTRTVPKRFCIDRFEYPNKRGATPVVMKTWGEAREACAGKGKRLCGDSEWTLACEGQDRLPYPYGHQRSAEACNIDKPRPLANESALANPKTRDAEIARLWQGEPSGTRASCTSTFGVFDMTGNVDEWVVNESGTPYNSALKGGFWGPVRGRCRSMTAAHNEEFAFYQIGFRCCRDVPTPTVAAR